MAVAHASAEVIRNSARNNGQKGSSSGYTYDVYSDGSSKLNINDSVLLSRAKSSGSSIMNGSYHLPSITVKGTQAIKPAPNLSVIRAGLDTGKAPYIYIDLGDVNTSQAYGKWSQSNLQIRYQDDYSLSYYGYDAASVASFQNKLLYLSRHGTDVSKYTLAELDALFEQEADDHLTLLTSFPVAEAVAGSAKVAESDLVSKLINSIIGKGKAPAAKIAGKTTDFFLMQVMVEVLLLPLIKMEW